MNIFYEPRRDAWKRAHKCRDCFIQWGFMAILWLYAAFGVIGTLWLAFYLVRSFF